MNSKIENLKARKADGGFTLVELLIVIVVLGVLAGITVFGVASFQEDATAAACAASAKTVEVAADAFHAKTPTGDYGTIAGLVTAGYLESAPTGVTLNSTTGVATCA